MNRKLTLLEVKSEIGAGTRGASLGIDAMKTASINFGSKFFGLHPTIAVPTLNRLLFEDEKNRWAKRIEGIKEVYKHVRDNVRDVLMNGYFPMVLAGDHSSAGGTIAGIRSALPGKRLGVIWVDAHTDLHTPYTTPSGNMHGMPLAAALGEDNKENQRNEVAPSTEKMWNELKNTFPKEPWILPQDLVFVGIRDMEQEEISLLHKHNITHYTVDQAREMQSKKLAKAILENLKQCDVIYISFDVDSMDCEVESKGTGTPVPHGLYEREISGLFDELFKSDKICCFEVVEVNPTLDDKGNKMAEIAFRIIEKVAKHIVSTDETPVMV